MNDIFFFVINMNKSKDRYQVISDSLDKIGCKYERIEAVDGTNMELDVYAKNLLACKTKLLNTKMECLAFNQCWLYDGSIQKSFPGLNMYGHYGTKGVTISNLRAYQRAMEIDCKWFGVLEDDAVINKNIYKDISSFLNKKENTNMDIILLDSRCDGWGGAAGILYNKSKINYFFEHLHPLSKFSIRMESIHKCACLWDWKLWAFIKQTDPSYKSINFTRFPCISSGKFKSTIDV